MAETSLTAGMNNYSAAAPVASKSPGHRFHRRTNLVAAEIFEHVQELHPSALKLNSRLLPFEFLSPVFIKDGIDLVQGVIRRRRAPHLLTGDSALRSRKACAWNTEILTPSPTFSVVGSPGVKIPNCRPTAQL